jgi:hypothetical protein
VTVGPCGSMVILAYLAVLSLHVHNITPFSRQSSLIAKISMIYKVKKKKSAFL